jgi:peptidoglycan hydrolase CwlO-like protein
MKKTILLFTLLLTTLLCSAQTDTVNKKLAYRPLTQQQVSIKTIPAAKAALVRKDAGKLQMQVSQFRDSLVVTKAEIDKLLVEMNQKVDNLSEMGEMESLRLQMAMDRLSKMMSTLSNIMKKISDTQNSITQNLK